MATLAGNLVNASPIGDMSIFFLALDSSLQLNLNGITRTIKLRDFYKAYKQTDRAPDEIIEKIIFTPPQNSWFNFEKVSKRTHLEQSLIATGFPYRANLKHIDSYLEMLRAVMLETVGIRRPGSAALDLCYVAAGRVDGFWELGLSKWDIAAGALIIREAGGRISDFRGTDGYLDSGNVVTGNPKIYAALSKLLAPFTKGLEK